MRATSSAPTFETVVAALKRYRLEENFTYRQLAQLIGVPHSRLHEVLTIKKPRVNDRTKYKIETFAQRVGILSERRVAS